MVWVREEAVLLEDEAGEPLYWQGAIFDITEQKEAVEELRRSEWRFRALTQNSSDLITLMGVTGTIRYHLNTAMIQVTTAIKHHFFNAKVACFLCNSATN